MDRPQSGIGTLERPLVDGVKNGPAEVVLGTLVGMVPYVVDRDDVVVVESRSRLRLVFRESGSVKMTGQS